MDSEDEVLNPNSDNENTEGLAKTRIVVVSSSNDTIKVHTNFQLVKDLEVEEIIKADKDGKCLCSKQWIIDISKITQSLETKEINRLLIKTLNPDANYSMIEETSKENTSIHELVEEEDKNSSDDDQYGLNDRSRYQKLSINQKVYLKNMLDTSKVSFKEIQSKFNVSYSALNRIKWCSLNQINSTCQRNVIKISHKERKAVVNAINDCVQTTKYVQTAKDITEHVNSSLGSSYSVNFVRNLMKSHMKLSYKRVKSRPNGVDIDRINTIRSLFSVKLAKFINSQTLLINIDESSINRNVKSHYSWGFKGIPIETNNSAITDSVSTIMGICSNGSWINLIVNDTIDSTKFVWFIKIMWNWLRSNDWFGYSQVAILLDNWAVHKSVVARNALEKTGCIIFFLPAYSPDFAPVEFWFSLMKRKLAELLKRENVKTRLKHNYTKIYDSLIQIKSQMVRKMYSKFFNTIKRYL